MIARSTPVVVVLSAMLASTPAAAWGPIGHRITAQIAQDNVSGKSRAQIERILGHEGLEEAATYPDEQRSNPDPFWQTEASPWHYVTLPGGQNVGELRHPPEGDAATALERFVVTLRDPAASRADKALALRFVVHLVSDLHQPLHAGNGTDRGGNDVFVTWFDEPQNLHWVWDEGLIARQQLSYSEYVDRLEARTAPDDVVGWWDANPATWIAESAALRDRIYPGYGEEEGLGTQESPVYLKYQYAYDWTPTMERRLQMAGIRTAAYLDWVFANAG